MTRGTPSFLPSLFSERWLGLAAISVSAIFLVLTGIVGVGRQGDRCIDFGVVYAAGRVLSAGLDPYDSSTLTPVLHALGRPSDIPPPFAYPPHAYALIAPFAALDFDAAMAAWTFLQVVAIVVSSYLATLVVFGERAKGLGSAGSCWFFAFALGNPIVSNNLWLGQPATLAYLGFMLGAYGALRARPLIGGIGLALAATKPQIAVFLCTWIALTMATRIVTSALLVTAAASVPAMLQLGALGAFSHWLARVGSHTDFIANAPGSENAIGLRSLLFSVGLNPPGLEWVGAALLAGAFALRRRLEERDVLAVIAGLTLLFVFNMDSAYMLVIPLLGALWRYAERDGRALLATAGLAVVFWFPRRVIRLSELPVLNHWRTLVVLALTALLWRLARRTWAEYASTAPLAGAEVPGHGQRSEVVNG